MKTRMALAAVVLLLSGSMALAQGEVQRTMAEELLGLMEFEKNLTATRAQFAEMIEAQFEAMDIPEKDRKRMIEHQKRIMDFAFEAFSWKNMKDRLVDVYVSVYTQEELGGLLAFFRSSLGQTFIQKSPELSRQLMAVVQEEMVALTPQIQAMTEDMMDEILAEEEAEAAARAEEDLD